MNHNDDMMEMALLGMMTGDASAAVDIMERLGQGDVVHSEMLPKDTRSNTREQFEALGFKFGKDVDELFIEATLPTGWTKQRTDHSMWSKIVDARGRERVSIFYKAAFYDRDAFMSLSNRHSYRGDYPVGGYGEGYDSHANRIGVVFDQEAIIWRTEREVEHYAKIGFPAFDALQKELQDEAAAYITEHYPDWRNPLAYWDDATAVEAHL